MSAAERLAEIRGRLGAAALQANRDPASVTLVAVSKTFPPEAVMPLIDAGQAVFGENRVQEASGKWPILLARHTELRLHLIGPLQTNKVRDALALFHAVHSLDRERLAAAIAKEVAAGARCPEIFVQVNTGEEPQKAGVPPREAVAFVRRCREVHGLPVAGLMCIPPLEDAPGPHFALLRKIGEEAGTGALSMGMSGDFETAIAFGATHVRIGSALFGARG